MAQFVLQSFNFNHIVEFIILHMFVLLSRSKRKSNERTNERWWRWRRRWYKRDWLHVTLTTIMLTFENMEMSRLSCQKFSKRKGERAESWRWFPRHVEKLEYKAIFYSKLGEWLYDVYPKYTLFLLLLLYIYVYVYVWREREREKYLHT